MNFLIYRKPTFFSLTIFSLSLSNVSFTTPLGILSISLITSFFLLLYFVFNKPFPLSLSSYSIIFFILPMIFFTYPFDFQSYGPLLRSIVVAILAIYISNAQFNKLTLYHGLLFSLYAHLSFFFLDFFNLLPLVWDNSGAINFGSSGFWRPSGLFAEPSFFAVSICCMLISLLSISRLPFHVFLFSLLSLIASRSVSGIVVILALFFTHLFLNSSFRINHIFQLKVSVQFLLISLLLSLFIFLDVSVDLGFLGRFSTFQNDGSFIQRSYGVYHLFLSFLDYSPLQGFGLDSTRIYDFINQIGSVKLSYFLDVDESACVGCVQLISGSTANSFVMVTLYGGLTSLIFYVIYLLSSFSSLLSLFPFIVVLFSFGQPFTPFIFLIPALQNAIHNK